MKNQREIYGYKIHPFCEMLPDIDGPEFDELAESIVTNGLREPILIWEEQVIDGKNRLRACEKAGVEPKTKKWGGSEEEAIQLVRDMGINRRQLSISQRAFAVAKIEAAIQAESPEDPPSNNDPTRKGRGKIAEEAGVSPSSIDRARKVERKGSDQVKNAVANGELSLGKASEIVEKPTEIQDQILSGGVASEDLLTLLQRTLAKVGETARLIDRAGEMDVVDRHKEALQVVDSLGRVIRDWGKDAQKTLTSPPQNPHPGSRAF